MMTLDQLIEQYNTNPQIKKHAKYLDPRQEVYCRSDDLFIKKWNNETWEWDEYYGDLESLISIDDLIKKYNDKIHLYKLNVVVWEGSTSFDIDVHVPSSQIKDGVANDECLKNIVLENKNEILETLWSNLLCRLSIDDLDQTETFNEFGKNVVVPNKVINSQFVMEI